MTSASDKPIDRLAASVLEFYGMTANPPIDVHELAKRMGVHSISRQSLIEDGRLEHRPGDTRIFISDSVNRSRARFTIGHELGHLLLAKPDVPLTARRMRANINDEERFCDAFAAALLLPAGWVRTSAEGRRPSLELARWLSDASGCSLASVVVRCNELVSWSRALLQWRRDPDTARWRWTSAAGVQRTLHGQLRSIPETQTALTKCQFARKPIAIDLPLAVCNRAGCAPAEVLPTAHGAIALVDLRPLVAYRSAARPHDDHEPLAR